MYYTDASQLRNHVIAQDDDNDYSESGWVAVVVDGMAALARYSHCSCYSTWDTLDSNLRKWDWFGTPDQIVELAKNDMDPYLPERQSDKKDYDHLRSVYDQIIEWDKKGRKVYSQNTQ